MECKRKPDISYPCSWGYRLIGENEDAIRRLVEETMGGNIHTVTVSNRNTSGKYVSLNVKTTVNSEEERNRYSTLFKESAHIKMVL